MFNNAMKVMATVLEEPWQIPQQLWDALLNHLLPPASDDRPEAFECALCPLTSLAVVQEMNLSTMPQMYRGVQMLLL